MFGAIIGDMVGSRFEYNDKKPKVIDLYNINNRMTDDSLLTIATAAVLLKYYPFDFSESEKEKIQNDLKLKYSSMVKCYPGAGFGASFFKWAKTPDEEKKPYNSCGNGSAMRISPVGWLANSIVEVKYLSKVVTEITHNHPEGLKGAECIAMCVFLARNGASKEDIKKNVAENYYPEILNLDFDDLVKNYTFNVLCQGSVPEAVYCFLISESLEDAVVKAVQIGGDSDTIACMAGAIAEAFYNKDSLSEIEQKYMDFFIEPQTEKLIKNFHKKTRLYYDKNNSLR